MYKLVKDVGIISKVTLINTDNNAHHILGDPSLVISALDTLTPTLDIKDVAAAWNFEINKETAKTLVDLLFTIETPGRTRKTKTKTKTKTKIDAMDVLLGLASY